MTFNIIIICLVVFILFILIYLLRGFKALKNKKMISIKIDLVQDKINLYLRDLEDHLKKTIEYFDESYKDNYKDINFSDLDNFELDNIIENLYLQFIDEINSDDSYLKNEDISNIYEDIKNDRCNLNASKKYYNDCVSEYNELKEKTRGVHLMCHFKKYDLIEIKETNTKKY